MCSLVILGRFVAIFKAYKDSYYYVFSVIIILVIAA